MSESHPTTKTSFRDILGAIGYRIGDDGTFWSRYKPGGGLGDQWRRIDPTRQKKRNHYVVGLQAEPGAPRRQVYIHRLVLEAFVGPCPPGMQGCHNDGDPSNNRLDNLRWDTSLNNHADTKKHGRQPQGSRQAGAKLKETDIPIIRKLYREGVYQQEIAQRFGVQQPAINKIIVGLTWLHVKEAIDP